jgi:hypothetical protein
MLMLLLLLILVLPDLSGTRGSLRGVKERGQGSESDDFSGDGIVEEIEAATR